MAETKYLYGASVQGIQGFIFQTNKLQEIAGASEIVQEICTSAFAELIYLNKKELLQKEDDKWIVGAAGKIIYIFDNKADCEKVVLEFPKKVMLMAPGITLSQAVVSMSNEESEYNTKSDELEKKLRSQRNKATRSLTMGFLAVKRAPSTGLPAIKVEKGVLIDEASSKKKDRESALNLSRIAFNIKDLKKEQIANNIDQMVDKNNWIAVIHADGNGLGKIVEKIATNAKLMKDFSSKLDEATKAAAQKAYDEVKLKFDLWKKEDQSNEVIPIRPVIIGGDDLMVICRADLAITYTQIFLEQFEIKTKELFKNIQPVDTRIKKLLEKGLTACAGIAFIKKSYPFHYGANLAESLCKRAKTKAKKINEDLAPSCLMFHKVQDSFVEKFEEIVERELTNKSDHSFEHGPYYLVGDSENKLSDLLENVKKLEAKEGKALKSNLRQWLTLLHDNVEQANQRLKRIIELSPDKLSEKLKLIHYDNLGTYTEPMNKSMPFYDMLTLASLDITTNHKKEKNE